MWDESERPSAETLRAFVDRLSEFRKTLPPEQQRLLDALLIAALRPDWWEDVQPYWARLTGSPPRARGPARRGPVTKRASRIA